ncbi:MAG TPA: Tm-1-like ATP-binding domain-containing protein, partial [Tepidisphaeraceae bacterium]|nr:Tm-1-like ATP-binding domain-containing protein [Tepidisphaeraceae bacterium]
MAQTILIIGAFDTKGEEYAFLRDQITERGHRVMAVNTGVMGTTKLFPVDVEADEVARGGGGDLTALREKKDRGEAMAVMARGAEAVVRKLFGEGRFEGIIGMGGSAGTAIITAAMRGLPIGVPKVCVSTVASGNTSPYVGAKDVVLFPSIVDVAGINRISRIIYSRAAGAICGM